MRFAQKRFRLSPEWRTLDFRPCSKVHPSSHSCESRNLRAERRKLSPKAYKCTITRRFAAAEIPAFAGMEFSFSGEFPGKCRMVFQLFYPFGWVDTPLFYSFPGGEIRHAKIHWKLLLWSRPV
ncbi:MAG: hypothetical protein ACR2QC_09380 [Gammaproteobacteria bacterium]